MVNALPELSLNRDARIQIWKIGEEKQPVLVVDDAFADAERLVEFAASAEFRVPEQNSYYPGLNAHLPTNYIPVVSPALLRPLIDLFGLPTFNKPRQFGFFGLTTLASADMNRRQALPHTDSANPNSFATVHFLNANFGGTAFYRHKATGFEVISNVRSYEFNKHRDREIEAGDTLAQSYEEIAYAEPLFNRLILYRATQLHSARIENPEQLTNDPGTGRLTANTFHNAT